MNKTEGREETVRKDGLFLMPGKEKNMLTEGARVRILRFWEIPVGLMPDEAINWEDNGDPEYIYGLSEGEIENERANGVGTAYDVRKGFSGVERECRIKFDNGECSEWRYAEQMLVLLDEETPLVVPESDPVSFLFA